MRKTVELGGQRGEMRIVTGGLAAGDKVIVKGLQRVRPGQKVEAEVAESGATETTLRKPVLPSGSLRTRPVAMPAGGNEPRSSQER
jgi:multidrug efflux system membrane fusion protein